MKRLDSRGREALPPPEAGTRVGGCGRKSTAPNKIRLPSIVELLCDEGEKAIESMNPTPTLSMVGAN
jgi:hypothetical protein